LNAAFEAILSKAKRGDPQAQFQAGNVLHMGLLDQDRDLGKARSWYSRAAEAGSADAQVNLAILLLRDLPSSGGSKDAAAAARWFRAAVESGDPQAAFYLGRLLLLGDEGVEPDPEEGVRLYRESAEREYAPALNGLGVLLMEGRFVERNPEEAARHYERAAALGDPEAEFNLGLCMLNGEGVRRDYGAALERFRSAARRGHAGAMHNAGVMFLRGQGVDVDETVAHGWFLQAAEKGEPAGHYEAGQGLRLGRGVPQDFKAAILHYKAAADLEFADAQFSLALMLSDGLGLERPMPEEAEPWYQRAAMNGHAGAAHNLGILYAKGIGVPRNPRTALELFEYAVSRGSDEALFSLALACATADPPDLVKAAVYARLSLQRFPEGKGGALLEKLAPMMTDAERERSRDDARRWTRPKKTLSLEMRRPRP
jgi:TPR repeat protein